MPLFYHKYVNYVLAHSVNYVITLYRLAPPVSPNLNHSPSFLICQISTITDNYYINSFQIAYGNYYDISGGASPSPTKSYVRNYTYSKDSASLRGFGDSAVALIHPRNY